MRFSRFSVQRPVFITMATLIVLILGGISQVRLPIDLMPDITYPTLSITTVYENASPEEMEELITRPVEEALSAVPGVEDVISSSTEGNSVVRVTFSWGTDLDAAANDVRDRLDRVMPRLPEEAERPTLRKYDVASFPVMLLGVSSHLDPVGLRRVIDDHVKYRIERLPGVASLDVQGGVDREIHVNLLPDKIKALGLPFDYVVSTVKAENVNLPAGTLERGNLEIMIRVPGHYNSIEELRDTVIAVRQGVPVQIKDIAGVEDTWQKVTRLVRVNGLPGVRLAVYKQSGTNTVEVAAAARAEIERINRDLPQIHVTSVIDTSDYIRRSITNVGTSTLYGGVLAILVLLLFLRNVGSTAVIATAIPISVIATFSLMYFAGFTLNLITLGGLALGIGMLVDNAIVVLENIYRYRELEADPTDAAVRGSEEVTAAIVASTLTTLAVFFPLVFVRGVSGIMFKQMAYVVSFSLACSLAVALTLVPMLSARIIRTPGSATQDRLGWMDRLFRRSARLFTSMENGYKRLLHFTLDHRRLAVLVSALIFLLSLGVTPFLGVEFMPATDQGEVRVYAEMAVGTRLELVDQVFQSINEVVKREVPEVKNTVAFVGGTPWRPKGSHTGELRIALKPESERSRSSEEIAGVLRRNLRGMPGVTIRTRAGQGLMILRMGVGTTDTVQVEIRGHDLETADQLAKQVKEIIEKVEGVTDAQISRESGSPEELILVDRQKAADMKLSVSQVANMLQTVLSGTKAGNYRESGKEYPIRVKVQEPEHMPLVELLDLPLTSKDGQQVVLRNVVQVRPRTGPVLIERKNQERLITVSANISGRDMGSILKDARKDLQSISVPEDFTITFGGDYEEQQKAFRELLLSFVLALILVYMVMACLYESLRDPFVVMFSVPLAAIGVIWMLFLTYTTFNVQSFIGCIMLGGIVVNNAILLVDHTNLLSRKEGMPLREAIEEAGRRRLRPILMTATTTMLALVPLALGLGEGGEAQAPMARAVLGGLFSSTLITLVIVPTVYWFFERRFGRRKMD